MRTTCFFCAAWLCVLFSTTASAQTLSSDEIVKLLSGITIETTGGNNWPQFVTFKANGTLEGKRVVGSAKRVGYEDGKWWTTKGGTYCWQWRTWRSGKKRCRFLVLQKDGKTITVLDRHGNELNEWIIK